MKYLFRFAFLLCLFILSACSLFNRTGGMNMDLLATIQSDINTGSYEAFMVAQAKLEQARIVFAGDLVAKPTLDRLIANYNLALANYAKIQTKVNGVFSIIQAGNSVRLAIAGKPPDPTLLHQIAPVPVTVAVPNPAVVPP